MAQFSEIAALRLGFGLSPLAPPPGDLAGVLASVDAATLPDGWTTRAAAKAQVALGDLRKALAAGEIDQDAFRAANQDFNNVRQDTRRRRVARAVGAPAGFGERLVQFWSDHFTTVAQNPPHHPLAAAFVDEALRPHLNGRFGDMLAAAETHPMMLVYLNQNPSFGPRSPFARKRPDRKLGLNENLGREVLELHSLGVGAGYTQEDVRQLAELLTGLTYDPREERRYRPQVAEPGAETLLGQRYGGGGIDGMAEISRAMGDLAVHPATAAHLSRKLAIHFAADEPPEELVRDLTDTWIGTGGDLAQVNALLAGTPTWPQLSPQCPAIVRFPGCRAACPGDHRRSRDGHDSERGEPGPVASAGPDGQPFGRPRGPDGWAEAASSWITPQLLSARIGWALRQPARLVDPVPDPRDFLATALGGTVSQALARAVPRAESAREGVAIVLPPPTSTADEEAPMLTRRTLTKSALLAGCSAAAHPWLNTVTFASAPGDNRLVLIILRGGMDGRGSRSRSRHPALTMYPA